MKFPMSKWIGLDFLNRKRNRAQTKPKTSSLTEEKKDRRAVAVLAVLLILALFLGCLFGGTGELETTRGTITDVSDLDGKTFVAVTGVDFELYIENAFPNAEIKFVSDWADTALSVSEGKADAMLSEQSSVNAYLSAYDNLTVLPGAVCFYDYRFCAAKTEVGTEAMELFNQYLQEMKQDGTMEAIYQKWADQENAPDHVESLATSGERGILRIVISPDWSPFAYLNNGNVCGYFAELAERFCAWAGYIPEYSYVDVQGMNAALSAGKADFQAYGCLASEERAEEVVFSASLYEEPVYAIIRADEYAYACSALDLNTFNREGVKIAAMSGSEQQLSIEDRFPRAEAFFTATMSDNFEALESGKVDAAVGYLNSLQSVFDSYSDLAISNASVEDFAFGFATGKSERGTALCEELSEYLTELKTSGEMDRIVEKWSNAEDGSYEPEHYILTGENGTLKVATSGVWCPKSFYSGTVLMGEFIDLVNGFCAAYGYMPEYECVTYEAEIAGVTSGTYDLVADSVVITEERLESVNISAPVMESSTYLFVKVEHETQTAEKISRLASLTTSLKKSFEKTFVREGRWKMLLSGLKVTIALALLAGVFGGLLGAGICALRMSKRRYLRALGILYIKVIQGTPIVVLLMLLYYIVFGDSEITAFWVCVIGFSVDFAAYAAEIFRTAIEAVPAGEIQAARALGFTSFGSFRQVTLPQAVTNGLPVFSGQFVAMVKQTSVAGYISVQDLTKISDIIRSRTYEAFFPLITTAVIYFLISALLISLLKMAEKRLNPALRPRTIKGVKVHD